MKLTFTIYGLIDDEMNIIYIGSTRVNIKHQLIKLYEMSKRSRLQSTLLNYLRADPNVGIVALTYAPTLDKAKVIKQYLIQLYGTKHALNTEEL